MSLPNRSLVSRRSRSRKRAISVESATTELTRLPGLEVAETKPELKPEHWIERGPSKRLMLFSGRAHPALAQRIADKLASAKRITAVLPLYPYSRQDKKSRPREGITAKLVAEMIQTAGADRVLTMDLHAGQIQGFFDVPVDHMTALPMLAQYVRDLGLPEDLVAVAPDTGRTRLASKFAEMIGGDLAVLQKDRPAHNVAHITNVIGDVDGKCAVMTDDMVDTAGTLVAGAQFLKERGAKKVYACATHGIFSPPAIERIEDSALDSVVVTDTVPINPLTKPERVTVLTVADILAETIHNVFADDSVSAIFGDMNALF